MARIRRSKLDNKGISLVEVIIAMTILCVVVIPVFQSLTTAMIYNTKARNRQNITLTAESIMETFKAESLGSLRSAFVNQTADISGIADGVYDWEAESEGESEYFTITDFALVDNTGKLYNAEITVTPQGTQTVNEAVDISTTNNAVFTAESDWDSDIVDRLYKYSYLSEGKYNDFYNDVFATKDSDWFENDRGSNDRYDFVELRVAETGEVLTSGNVLEGAYIENYITVHDRTLTFEVTKDNDTYKVTAKMVYRYYIDNFTYNVVRTLKVQPDLILNGDATNDVYTNTARFPANADDYLEYSVGLDTSASVYSSDKPLNNLYIYYYPQYDVIYDKIDIKVSGNMDSDFDCYIIKQKPDGISDNKLYIKENKYKLYATLYPSGSMAKVNLYHNLQKDLSGKSSNGLLTEGRIEIDGFNSGVSGSLSASRDTKEEKLYYNIDLTITDSQGNVVINLESSLNEKISDEVGDTSDTTKAEGTN